MTKPSEKKPPADKPDHPHGGPPGQQPPPVQPPVEPPATGVRTDVAAAVTARGAAVANTWVIPAGPTTGGPELPRVTVDTALPATAGYVTYTVKSLQAALEAATPGDVIAVDPPDER